MTLKKQIKKLDHYDVHERSTTHKLGAIVLAAATVLSIVVEHHDTTKRMAKSDIVVNPGFVAKSEIPEKNEMVRMPIKFDDGLRAAATTGA
jgi:hypothetical protein